MAQFWLLQSSITYPSPCVNIRSSICVIMIQDGSEWYLSCQFSICYRSPCLQIRYSINVIMIEDGEGPFTICYLSPCLQIGYSINVIMIEDGEGPFSICYFSPCVQIGYLINVILIEDGPSHYLTRRILNHNHTNWGSYFKYEWGVRRCRMGKVIISQEDPQSLLQPTEDGPCWFWPWSPSITLPITLLRNRILMINWYNCDWGCQGRYWLGYSSIFRFSLKTDLVMQNAQLLTNRDMSFTNRDMSFTNRDMTFTNRDMSFTNRDMSFTNRDMSFTNRDMST